MKHPTLIDTKLKLINRNFHIIRSCQNRLKFSIMYPSEMLPCSSVAEQAAVNRWVVGSNPTGGAR